VHLTLIDSWGADGPAIGTPLFFSRAGEDVDRQVSAVSEGYPTDAGSRARRHVERGEPLHCVGRVRPAHFLRWHQAAAERRALRATKDATAHVVVELDAADTGGFPVRHAGDRAGDGRRDAARTATWSAGRFRQDGRGEGGWHDVIVGGNVGAGGAAAPGRLKSGIPQPVSVWRNR